MDESTLKSIIVSRMRAAAGSSVAVDSDLSKDREKALDYYRGDPFGDEVEGRSQVVMTDVADVVEGVLPSLLEPFIAGDDIVSYQPVGQEDEGQAKQATEYVNHIVHNDNPSFTIFHTWFKDAVLQRLGVVKSWWHEEEKSKKWTQTALSAEQIQMVLAKDGTEVVAATPCEHEYPEGMPYEPLYDVTFERKWKDARVVIANVPPDEFLFTARATSQKDAPILGERSRKTRSELVAMGFDRDQVMSIPAYDEADLTTERQNRYDPIDEGGVETIDEADPASVEVLVCEFYIRVDYDGDGIAELRKIICGGGEAEVILENEECDEDPYSLLTPIPMPHTIVGRSYADQTMDIQRINSTLMRQVLDNMYQTNNSRSAVSNKVDLDDLLSNRVGGVVRVDTPAADVAGHIVPMVTAPLAPVAFPVMEYMEGRKESRTGFTKYNQGLDADSLNKTKGGIQMIMGAAQARQHLVARGFAETGVKDLYAKILRLVIKHQDRARTIRLRGEWVPMDPRHWNSEMDCRVSVGLGHGTKDQQATMTGAILSLQEKIITMQGGIGGPLVYADNVKYGLDKFVTGPAGFKDPDKFFADPNKPQQTAQPPGPPKPDPLMAEVQGTLQIKAQESQAKLALESQKAQTDMQMAQQNASLEMQMAKFKAELEAQTKLRVAEIDAAAKIQVAQFTEGLKAQSGYYTTPQPEFRP
jgi:hypothetical protein